MNAEAKGKIKLQEREKKLENLHEVICQLGLKTDVILTVSDKREHIKFGCRMSQDTGTGNGWGTERLRRLPAAGTGR